MRIWPTVAASFLLLTGCTASVSVGTDTGSSDAAPPTAASPSGAPALARSPNARSSNSASPSAATGPSAVPSLGPGFTMVSANLASPGINGFSAVSGDANLVAAATFSVKNDDTDVGLVYSLDGGLTWIRGGDVALPDNQHVDGLMITEQGVVMVGRTSIKKGDRYVDEALILAAPAPDYVPQVVPNPAQFDGDVSLLTAFKEGSDWVIVGSTSKPESKGSTSDNSFPTVWRSADEGSTWSRKVLTVKGSSDTPLYSFTMGPDGSWNLFGESYPASGDQQFNASWVRSTDSGASFQLMYPGAFRKIHDQGSHNGVFSASGAIAIDGWDEIVDSGDQDISVAWVGSSGQSVKSLGDPKIPVQGGTPPGEFESGLLWDNETLVMWGSKDGTYPTPEVQFWAWDGSQFVPATTLPGNGELVGVGRIVSNGDRALLFGSTGPEKDQRNLAVWVGSLTQ
jgi:hypothetical protein